MADPEARILHSAIAAFSLRVSSKFIHLYMHLNFLRSFSCFKPLCAEVGNCHLLAKLGNTDGDNCRELVFIMLRRLVVQLLRNLYDMIDNILPDRFLCS